MWPLKKNIPVESLESTPIKKQIAIFYFLQKIAVENQLITSINGNPPTLERQEDPNFNLHNCDVSNIYTALYSAYEAGVQRGKDLQKVISGGK